MDRTLFQKVVPMELSTAVAFLEGFLKHGRLEIALDILSLMGDRDYFAQGPNEEVLCVFLDSITELKHLRYLEKILHALVKHHVKPTNKTKEALQKMFVRIRDLQGTKNHSELASPDHPINHMLKALTSQIEKLSLGDPMESYFAQIASIGQTKPEQPQF